MKRVVIKLSLRKSSMKNSALLVIILVGMTMLTAATFIANHVLFASQPDIENILSIIWTVALAVVMYRLLLYMAPTKNATRAEWRRNFYGGMVFLCEVLAVVTLIITAVIFSTLLTSGEKLQTPLVMMVGVVALLALGVPVSARIVRVLNQRLIRAENQADF